MKISIFWFRRDLRLEDNRALEAAQKKGLPILPLFIFDTHILKALSKQDSRVQFIYQQIKGLHQKISKRGSSLKIIKGDPLKVWKQLIQEYNIESVFFNRDYEPYAQKRDSQIKSILESHNITVTTCKDRVIFEPHEILKKNGTPYTVFTPYKNQWLTKYHSQEPDPAKRLKKNLFLKSNFSLPSLRNLGFLPSPIKVQNFNLSRVKDYAQNRDYPGREATSGLGPHLRFGTISLREVLDYVEDSEETFLSELIWREFFTQIMAHFPHVVGSPFKPKYNALSWRNQKQDFELWCKGKTGYPLVDAGMRQLKQTGTMHNRVRMITAGFLCKHLLIDWRWGEAYFAQHLLDYELASNNGNWQWAAGTGCDAAPYFRIFNPVTQQKKFDGNNAYINQWIPELYTPNYPRPMVDHKFARERALQTYQECLYQESL